MKTPKCPTRLRQDSLNRPAPEKHHVQRMIRAPVLDAVQLRIDERGKEQAPLAPHRLAEEPQHCASIRFVEVREDGEKPDHVELPWHRERRDIFEPQRRPILLKNACRTSQCTKRNRVSKGSTCSFMKSTMGRWISTPVVRLDGNLSIEDGLSKTDSTAHVEHVRPRECLEARPLGRQVDQELSRLFIACIRDAFRVALQVAGNLEIALSWSDRHSRDARPHSRWWSCVAQHDAYCSGSHERSVADNDVPGRGGSRGGLAKGFRRRGLRRHCRLGLRTVAVRHHHGRARGTDVARRIRRSGDNQVDPSSVSRVNLAAACAQSETTPQGPSRALRVDVRCATHALSAARDIVPSARWVRHPT